MDFLNTVAKRLRNTNATLEEDLEALIEFDELSSNASELVDEEYADQDFPMRISKNGSESIADYQNMGHLRKIILLLWKNYVIQRRTPIRTLIQFLIPLTMSFILIGVRFLVKFEEIKEPVRFENFTIGECLNHSLIPYNAWNIGYSPSNQKIVKEIMDNLELFSPLQNSAHSYTLEAFENEASMVKRMAELEAKNSLLAGIVFDHTNFSEYPHRLNVKVSIRFPGLSRFIDVNSTTLDTQAPNWRTHINFPLYQPFGPRDAHTKFGGQPGYCKEGFLNIQHSVYKACLKTFLRPNITEPDIDFQRFPYPPYTKDQYLPALILFISIFIIVMYTFSSVSTIKMITLEKETQMKSAMKIMGLPNWMHWTAWTLKEFIQWMLPTICITFLLTYNFERGCVIRKSDPLVFLSILAAYTIASIMFCFLVSVCFNKANSAATIGSALWFLTYSPFMVLQPKYENMTYLEVMSWSLLSNTNIGFLFQFLVNFEGVGVGLQWYNLFEMNSPNDKVSAGNLLVMLLIDSLVYFMLAIYIESAFPGNYGISKPWYFPLQSSYWLGPEERNSFACPQKGIQIKHLTKRYRGGKLAVNNLSLNMHEDQITVLLGNNGAGKSSTMSMLSGMIKPTSGTAIINGFDIWSDKSKIRSSLGLCPQYNLLFPELTIKEHLQFFGMLKGVKGKELDKEIDNYVTKLKLQSKLNFQAGALSGGYQRKLSVAIALIGKSKVVLMDEPTSGMDPVARRLLWDLLQSEREGRTMVMTTHLMDEADLLGDRVAIMCNGELKCVGTPFNLKTDPEGYRYTLNLVKDDNDKKDVGIDVITKFLKAICENIRIASISETEIKYKILDSRIIPKLLTTLDEVKGIYGIKEFGVSLISLEDVYTRLTADLAEEKSKEQKNNRISIINHKQHSINSFSVDLNAPSKSCKVENSCQRWMKQLYAMLLKKMLISKRSWMMVLTQCVITFVFFIIAVVVTKSWKGSSDLLPLNFSLTSYHQPIIVEKKDGIKNESEFLHEYQIYHTNPENNFFNLYRKLINNQSGTVKSLNKPEKRKRSVNSPVDDFLLDKYHEHIQLVNDRYIGAIELMKTPQRDTIRIHFNNQPYHSLPILYNVIQNATLKYMTNGQNSISFTNYPFPYQPSEKITKLEGGSNLGFQIGFNSGFSQAFICATFLMSTMKEKANGATHLQFVSGVAPTAYWLASVLWDYVMYMVPLSVEVLMLLVYQDEAYSDSEQLVQVVILLVAYNWAIMPIMNIATYVFNVPTLAFLVTSVFGVISGCAMFLINLILEIRPLMLVDEAEDMNDVMVWFPHYSLCNGLRNIYANYEYRKARQRAGEPYDGNYGWDRPAIGRNLFVLFVMGFVFNVTLLCLENVFDKRRKFVNIVYKYWSHLGTKAGMEHEMNERNETSETDDTKKIDEDVMQEKYTVENSSKLDYAVLIKDVTKKYGHFTAVKHLNLALGAHECFALLGSNGAGKTSTFKMLTSKMSVTSGSIDICSMDIVRHQDKVARVIGYCPQQDALLSKLTGRETLMLFCTLRGVPRDEIKLVINQLSSRLIFHKFLDVPSGRYSGGNKRKLNTAVAMVGDPPVLLLDEPTSGMDPDARRHLWNVIKEERERGKCIIITTHSLEECEALCTRLAIMVEGELRCIGSVQHLKNKFASGYKLHIKFPPKLMENIKLHVKSKLLGSSIHEEFKGMIVFHIPSNVPCSTVFYMMEEAKSKSIIEDYSIQQTSLEQVFTRVTK